MQPHCHAEKQARGVALETHCLQGYLPEVCVANGLHLQITISYLLPKYLLAGHPVDVL